jgi:hypothetical protein
LSVLSEWSTFQVFTWLVPLSVLVASLVGSLHCASMCGPLILNVASDRRRLMAYHSGRGAAYILAGSLAGGFGQGVLDASRFPWLSQLSLAFIATTLLYMGARTLLGRGFHLRMPGPVDRLSRRLWQALRLAELPPWATALLTGVLTIFLPCGHLYGFLVGAMATGHWWAGAIFMAAFWLGTLPALAFGASWIRKLLRPGLSQAPRVTGLILIAAGLFGVVTFASRLYTNLCH